MMLTVMRNHLFMEKAYLIHEVMQRYYRMLKACQMEEEDVYQSLSLRLLESLDAYDSGVNPNLDAYLRQRLEYEMLHLALPSRRFGISYAPRKTRLQIFSLDELEMNRMLSELSVQGDPSFYFWLKLEIASLPDAQRMAVNSLLNGKRLHCSNKALQSARAQIRVQMENGDSRLLSKIRKEDCCA